ncbi:AAA family ATPase [Streptomyces griseoincarnatus]
MSLSLEETSAVRALAGGRCLLTMGASGSGKSTTAARLAAAAGAIVVSHDHTKARPPAIRAPFNRSPVALAVTVPVLVLAVDGRERGGLVTAYQHGHVDLPNPLTPG